MPSTPFLLVQSQPHYPSHRLFALPVLYAFMQAIPSAWNAIHCLLPFHHSLLFPMKSFRVQLKCHHLSILKFALTPFHVGMVHCPFLCLYFVYCMVSQLSFGQLTKWILLNFRANVFLYAAVSTVHLSHSGIIFFFFLDVLVTQSCLTFCNTVDCIAHQAYSVHEIQQVKNTGAISFSQGSSPSRDQTQVACIAGRFFTI